MYSIDNPAEMTSDERYLEVAWDSIKGILAPQETGFILDIS